MTQDERWAAKYNEVIFFIDSNHRNPSKHDEEERGKYLNWIKANRKALNAGKMKPERKTGERVPVSRIIGVSNNQ